MTRPGRPGFEATLRFDPKRHRHYMNGVHTVLHCHHYATLLTQMADDAAHFDGIRLLSEAAEDVFFDVLGAYYETHHLEAPEDRISVAEDYWKVVGMGLIRFTAVGSQGLEAEMAYSQVDEGWLSKWGSRERPVNFITAGFVAAVAALITKRPRRSFSVKETKGLVCGDDMSAFKATLR